MLHPQALASREVRPPPTLHTAGGCRFAQMQRQNDSLGLDLPRMQPSSLGIKTPPNNSRRGNANHRLIHWIIGAKKGVSSCLHGFRDPSDLYSTQLPGGQDIIDHQRDMWVLQDVAKLLAPTEILSTNIDLVLIGIIAETNGCDLRFAVRPNGC